jgi:hypothetical protein
MCVGVCVMFVYVCILVVFTHKFKGFFTFIFLYVVSNNMIEGCFCWICLCVCRVFAIFFSSISFFTCFSKILQTKSTKKERKRGVFTFFFELKKSCV